MKLNWLGKAFLGAAGAYAVGKVVESATSGGETDVEGEGFSEEVVAEMAEAYRQDDYSTFRRIYKRYRGWADEDNVAETWRNFGRVLRG